MDSLDGAASRAGDVVLTGGDIDPIVWRYDPPALSFDPGDAALELFESFIRAWYPVAQRGEAGSEFADENDKERAGNGETVLVNVENETDRRIARVILQDAGYRVLEGTDATDADIVVLDAAGDPRAVPVGVPILRCYALSESPPADGGSYVVRPFHRWVFLAAVRRILDRQKYPGA
ncbi:MAG: hypothetical protein M5R36_12040 [Deltaproteobacteria bacterium]|nr:hypothetical protein [Deltaproteobacteria bacterium]